jgi:valyl-tRNA synthetase
MVSRLNQATKEVRAYLDEYRFNDAATVVYRFIWNEFCDWGIELSKADKSSIVELGAIFKESMKLLHPFMPFITEYLWHSLSGTTLEDSDSIMIKKFPTKTKKRKKDEERFEVIMDAIVSIRRAKTLIDMANQKIEKAYVKVVFGDEDKKIAKAFIQKLAKVEDIEFTDSKIEGAVSDVGEHCEVFIPTREIDLTPVLNRLTKQQEKLQKEIDKLSKMFQNERFVANAPQEVLEKNKEALKDAKQKYQKVTDQLTALKDL